MPSPVCEISRVAYSLRNPPLARTVRRSPMNDRAAGLFTPSGYGRAANSTVHGSMILDVSQNLVVAQQIRRQKARIMDIAGARLTSAVEFAADELLDRLASDVVAVLLGRRLHEVRRRRHDRPAVAAVHVVLSGAIHYDHDSGHVRRVPILLQI